MSKTNKFLGKPILLSCVVGSLLAACSMGKPSPSNSGSSPGTTAQSLSNNALTANKVGSKGTFLGAPSVNVGNPASASPDVRILEQRAMCINLADNDVLRSSNEVSNFSYKINMTTEEALSNMGINGSLKGSYKDLSGDFAAQYQDAQTQTSKQITYTLFANSSKDFSLQKSYPLKNEFSNSDISTCGDSYVAQVRAGIYVQATVKLIFDSSVVKNTIAANGNIKYGSLIELSGSLDKLDSSIKNNMRIEIDLAQRGGDTAQIFAALNEIVPGESDKTFYVTTTTIDNASKILDKIQDYLGSSAASGQGSPFKQQVDKYLKTATTVDSMSNLYVTATDVVIQKYPDSSKTYSPDRQLQALVDTHSDSYSELLKFKTAYQKYHDFITSVKIDGAGGKAPPAIISDEKNYNLLVETLNTMRADANMCYGYLESATIISECKEILQNDVILERELLSNINSTNWNKGYKLRSSTTKFDELSDIEYLIYLGEEADGTKDFITYSDLPTAASYAPGTTYYLAPEQNELKVAAINEPLDTLKSQSLFFELANFKYTDTAITHSSAAYYNLEGEESTPAFSKKIPSRSNLVKINFN